MFMKRLLHVGLRQTNRHLQGAWRRGAERPGGWRAAVRRARPAQSARHRYLLTGPSSRRGCLLLETPPLLTPPVVPFKFSYADEHQTNLGRELRTSQRLRFELRSYSKPTRLFFFFFKVRLDVRTRKYHYCRRTRGSLIRRGCLASPRRPCAR